MINNPLRERPDVEDVIRTMTDTTTLLSPGWTSSSSDNGGRTVTLSRAAMRSDPKIQRSSPCESSEDEEPAERTSSVERRLIEANHFFYRYSTSYRPGAKEDKTSPSRVGWGNREVTTASKSGRVILFYIQT